MWANQGNIQIYTHIYRHQPLLHAPYTERNVLVKCKWLPTSRFLHAHAHYGFFYNVL